MLKKIILFFNCILLFSCQQEQSNTKQLEEKIKELESKLQDTYKPGFGEFMGNIQVHHNKLYFAGINKNWELADFEVNEIKEAMEDINKFCTDRPEAKSIEMINPALDSISRVITNQNSENFNGAFIYLTNTCNNCHRNTSHGFNLITIPTAPPFSNQNFESNKWKN